MSKYATLRYPISAPRLIGRSLQAFCCALLACFSASAAKALELTPASANAGWKLSVFAGGFPVRDKTNVGPLGIAFANDGKVMVSDYHGEVYIFPSDADGQKVSDATVGHVYPQGQSLGLARVGANYYMATQADNRVVQLNPDGTFSKTIASFSLPAGICANPNNGHLWVSYVYGVADVNPVTGVAVKYLGIGACDGVATDGSILYTTLKGHILGYRISDKAKVFDSGFILGADGIALGSGSLAGLLFVNTNYGQVFQIDLATQVITLIATGGNRGDFIAVDPNGSLLITQSYGVWRLTPPAGSSFVTANVSVSPSSIPGGVNATGKVTLNVAAPKDMEVSLASGNASASVPASVVIAAGSRFGLFDVATTAVSEAVSGAITASLNGLHSATSVTVRPVGVKAFTLKPATTKGGVAVQGVIALEAVAAPGDIVVTFSSSDGIVAAPPVSVTVKAGQQTATISIPVTKVVAKTVVTLSATANGIVKTANLTVNP